MAGIKVQLTFRHKSGFKPSSASYFAIAVTKSSALYLPRVLNKSALPRRTTLIHIYLIVSK